MPKIIAGSSNISVLDQRLYADQCEGKIRVDLTPSVFIGGGANNVLGAKIRMKNPLGILVRDFGVDYDILPPMTTVVSLNIPKVAGKYQTGTYIITVELTDANGKKYTFDKSVEVCMIEATLSAKIKAVCNKGFIAVSVSQPPSYKGRLSTSKNVNLKFSFPSASGVDFKMVTAANFADALYEGVYQIKGTICAEYNLGDNVFASILYDVFAEKDIKCSLDESCIFLQLKNLHDQLNDKCSDEQRSALTNVAIDAVRLWTTAKLAIDSGEDPSDFIDALEALLGMKCTCQTVSGVPVIQSPSLGSGVVIEGCNVESSEDGLTTTYTINNYQYEVTVLDNNEGILTITPAVLVDGQCIKKQTILFDKAKMYASVVAQASADIVQAAKWAAVINATLTTNPPCFNLTDQAWAAISFKAKFDLLFAKICACCECKGQIHNIASVTSGQDVTVSFTLEDVFMADVFLDDVFVTTVLGTATGVTIEGAADGVRHEVTIHTKDQSGKYCSKGVANFTYFACVVIAPPVLSSHDVSSADCPFDLTTLLPDPLPSGLTVEWYSDQDRRNGSRVNFQTAAPDGRYYAFYKNADGCYSVGTSVSINCHANNSCTAPQNLSVTPLGDGNNLVRFNSAAYPPPSNAYVVKRRLASDPDTEGSYITLDAPIFNAGLNKWEAVDDNSPLSNIMYVYSAESNCGSTHPRTTTQFARVGCPEVDAIPMVGGYKTSFAHLGGGITKYRMRFFNITQNTEMIPYAFNSPFTGPIEVGPLPTTDDIRYSIDIYIGSTIVKTCEYNQPAVGDSLFGSANFGTAEDEGDVCAASNVELFFQGSLGEGSVLRTTPNGSPLVSDVHFVRFPNGDVYNIDNGVVGSATGANCNL